MPTLKEIQRLKNRYDLRADGAELRDLVEFVDSFHSSADNRKAILEQATHAMTKKDRLFFRQGYFFQAGVNNV